jgi:hypothetical protein
MYLRPRYIYTTPSTPDHLQCNERIKDSIADATLSKRRVYVNRKGLVSRFAAKNDSRRTVTPTSQMECAQAFHNKHASSLQRDWGNGIQNPGDLIRRHLAIL